MSGNKIKYVEYFTKEELIFLLAGEMLFGRKCLKILIFFKYKFKSVRTRTTLAAGFKTLNSPKNQSLLEKLLPLAKEIAKNYKVITK